MRAGRTPTGAFGPERWLLRRRLHRDSEGFGERDVDEIADAHPVEVARVARHDRPRAAPRTLEVDRPGGLVDRRDAGGDGRDPRTGDAGPLAGLGARASLRHAGPRHALSAPPDGVGDRLVVGG